jgi:hypothetical protein
MSSVIAARMGPVSERPSFSKGVLYLVCGVKTLKEKQ